MSLTNILTKNPIRVLDDLMIQQSSDQQIVELLLGYHKSNEMKEMLTLLYFYVILRQGESQILSKTTSMEHIEKVQHLLKISGQILQEEADNTSTWNQLKIVHNTLVKAGYISNGEIFPVSFSQYEKYLMEGLTELFLARFAKDRKTKNIHLSTARESLLFHSVLCPTDNTYFLFASKFIQLIPDDDLESFTTSLLFNIDLEDVKSIIQRELICCFCNQRRASILQTIKKALNNKEMVDLDELMDGFASQMLECDMLKIGMSWAHTKINDPEFKINCLLNLIQFIDLSTPEPTQKVRNTLKLLSFEMIRPINIAIESVFSFPERVSDVLCAAMNYTVTGLADNEVEVVFSNFAKKTEYLFESIRAHECKTSLCFVLLDIFLRLAHMTNNPEINKKKDIYSNRYSQLLPADPCEASFYKDYESDDDCAQHEILK